MFRSTALLAILIFSSLIFGQDYRKADELNDQGLRLYESGDYDAALKAFNRSIEIVSGLSRKPKVNKSSLASSAELADFALVDQVRVVDPRTAIALSNRGNVYFAKSQLDRALEDYNDAIRILPTLVPAYVRRGNTYLIKRDFQRALADYDRAAKLAPEDYEAYLGRAIARSDMGDKVGASQDFDKVLSLAPQNAEAYARRGEFLRTIDKAKAFADFDRAIALDGSCATAFTGRGTLFLEAGEFQLAIENFTTGLRIDPRLAQLYIFRGYALLYQHKDDEAQRDFDRAIRMAPRFKGEIAEGLKLIKSKRK